MLRKGVPVPFVQWIQGFLSNRQVRVCLNRAYCRTWVMRKGLPQGPVLAPLLFLLVIDDLQDRLLKGVHSSLFVDDSALRVHTPRLEDAVPVLLEVVREVHRWSWAKKLTLNRKKCEVSFFSADVHEANWRPVFEVEGTILWFNPTPPFLGVLYDRTLPMKPQADRKAASLSKGSQMLAGSAWGWNGDILQKVYQTSLLSGLPMPEVDGFPVCLTMATGNLERSYKNCNCKAQCE
jgi:ribonuclease P/MRP protein subunit RPP40